MAKRTVSQRGYDLQRVAHLYQHAGPYGLDVCVYCGDPANTIDHVCPVWHVARLFDHIADHAHRLRHGLLTVPSCRDCNSRLGGFIAYCVSEKREELKRRLRRKYQHLLGEYDWQPEELAELGHSLRSYIQGQETKRDWIMSRLHFPRPWEARLLRARYGT